MLRWIDSLLRGVSDDPSLRAGEGFEVSFVHTWPWPPWITLLFLMAAAGYVLLIYFREGGPVGRGARLALAALRLTLIALVVAMMYGWMREPHRTDLPDIIVVVDDSGSMSVVDQYEDRALSTRLNRHLQAVGLADSSRVNLSKGLLLDGGAGWLSRLRSKYNLKLYFLSTTARAQSGNPDVQDEAVRTIEASQSASRLGDGLQDILEAQRGRPTAAVILLTDGVTTEGKSIGEVSQYAYRKGVPLYVVGLGDDRPPRDLRLSDLMVDDTVFLGDLLNFDVKLAGSGFASQEVRVVLKRKGQAAVLAQRRLTIPGDNSRHSVRLSHRPAEEGEFEFAVEVEPLKNETNLDNNCLAQVVDVRDEIIRVLFVQEYPSLEFRYLKTLLERSLQRSGERKSVQLTTVLQEADEGYVESDATALRVFPVNREELFSYDVLIFGDVNPVYMSRQVIQNVTAFVKERGGGIVFISGPRHTPLAYRDTDLEDLFPIDLGTARLPADESLLDDSFRVQPTRLGLASSQMQLADTPAENLDVWNNLPAIRWVLFAPDTHLAARVLAEHSIMTTATGSLYPVICTQFVGAGRVVFHATDETYLWSRFRGTDEYYERYWIQTIRYLSRTKLLGGNRAVEMPADQTQYYRGEPVSLRVRFFDERMAPATDDGVVVMVERDEGRRQKVTLHRDEVRRGMFEGAVSNLAEGAYRAWVVTPTLEGKPPARRFAVVPSPGERARLQMDKADLVLAAETSQGKFYTIGPAERLLNDLPRGRQVRIESFPATPVWNSWFLAGLFFLLLIVEWLWRRRVGWM